MQNGCDSVTVVTVWKMNTTETQPKPQNASHCHKPHCHNACASLRATQSMKPLLETAMKPRGFTLSEAADALTKPSRTTMQPRTKAN